MKTFFYFYSIRDVNTFYLSFVQILSHFPLLFHPTFFPSIRNLCNESLPSPSRIFTLRLTISHSLEREKLSISGVHPFEIVDGRKRCPPFSKLGPPFPEIPSTSSFLPFNWSQRTSLAHEFPVNSSSTPSKFRPGREQLFALFPGSCTFRLFRSFDKFA